MLPTWFVLFSLSKSINIQFNCYPSTSSSSVFQSLFVAKTVTRGLSLVLTGVILRVASPYVSIMESTRKCKSGNKDDKTTERKKVEKIKILDTLSGGKHSVNILF